MCHEELSQSGLVDMDYFFDLAFALANRSLCLFTGAGFSKQLTSNKMPSWKKLLESLCTYLDDQETAERILEESIKEGLPLEDCARILELRFLKEKKDLREAISEKVRSYKIDEDTAEEIASFLKNHKTVKIISTNYDDLVQRLMLPDQCNSNYPGKPVTNRDGMLEIYHIHGSVLHPPGIVATTEDYYNFINSPTYFSRKIFTLMAEQTVLFLGYALGDPNLKAVLHEFRNSNSGTLSRGNLFYVTKSSVPQYLKDHFEISFGLFVIDKSSIDQVLRGVEREFPEAEKQVTNAEANLKNVLSGTHTYTTKYLKSSKSLSHIISVANKTGQSITQPKFIRLLSSVLENKVKFTGEDRAWEQYGQLAEWLVYLGSLIRISETKLELPYLEAVQHSMKRMSGTNEWGYSWEAFRVWEKNWGNIMFYNRRLISEHVREHLSTSADALKITASL